MSRQPLATQRPRFWVEEEASKPSLTARHQGTLERLTAAFEQREALVVLTSDGRSDTSYIVDEFMHGLDGSAERVLIRESSLDAIANMRELVDGIGFKPRELSLADLENVLSMFLAFQKRNGRRTVICFEEAQDNGWWVLDNIRRIVEKQLHDDCGLLVLLTGRESLLQLLDKPPLDTVAHAATTRLRVSPLSATETREYVRQQLESTGQFEIGQVFDFEAVARMHELSKGVPDSVETLCCKCLEMVDADHADTVTIEMVEEADKQLRNPHSPNEAPLQGEQVVAHMKGELIVRRALDRGRILIGRDRLCDIRLPSRFVSRHQALIVKSSYGTKILDLGSRNGSFVGGRPFRDHTLADGDVITFGDCTIEYVAD